jgi:hypothetical protein
LTGPILTGADMSNATLDGVSASAIVGTPSLPAGWKVIKGYLVGPGANLGGADLSGANLAFLDLRAASFVGANLTNALLGGADLEGADLRDALLTGVTWGSTTCPDGVSGTSTPCGPTAWLGTSTVVATSNGVGGTLLIDVGPTLDGDVEWRVQLQTLTESGGWVVLSRLTTKGTDDELKLNLPSGSYRAVAPPQRQYRGSTSLTVVLEK